MFVSASCDKHFTRTLVKDMLLLMQFQQKKINWILKYLQLQHRINFSVPTHAELRIIENARATKIIQPSAVF